MRCCSSASQMYLFQVPNCLHLQLWREILRHELGPVPKVLHAPCCAQFLVSRERILARPKVFYERLAMWLQGSPRPGGPRRAMVMEYLWHMIFGEPARILPVEKCALLFCDEPQVVKDPQEGGSVMQEGELESHQGSDEPQVLKEPQEGGSVQQEGVLEPQHGGDKPQV